MPTIIVAAPSGRYLSFEEREEIALLVAEDCGVREIARRVGRHPSTVSRELRRNVATRSASRGYRASVAQWKAEQAARRPKPAKLATNDRLETMCSTSFPARSPTLAAGRYGAERAVAGHRLEPAADLESAQD